MTKQELIAHFQEQKKIIEREIVFWQAQPDAEAEKPKVELCESCKWWIRLQVPCGDGECRKHAPELRVTNKPVWPITRNSFGCGDWKEKV